MIIKTTIIIIIIIIVVVVFIKVYTVPMLKKKPESDPLYDHIENLEYFKDKVVVVVVVSCCFFCLDF